MMSAKEAGDGFLRPGWLEAQCRALGADPEGIRRFRNALLKRGEPWERALSSLPEALQGRFLAQALGKTLTLEAQEVSKLDGATKLMLRTARGLAIETVVMQMQSGRSAVCVSSQVGCAVRCSFCATGQASTVRSLSSQEILGQVVFATQRLAQEGRRLRNVVFMGMGEPLLNEDALHESLEALTSPQHFDLSARHVLVSTVGIPHKMVRLARAMPKIGIALSLHSAQQNARAELIPLGHRYPLSELKSAIAQCNAVQARPIMIEYLLLEGRNDSPDAVDALLEFCAGLSVRINLIPYNRVPDLPFAGTKAQRQTEIASRIRSAGLEVTIRRSLGADIAAACGQLVALRSGAPKR